MNGNVDAAEELIDLYGQGLILFIYGFVKDRHYAEELMIEAFAIIMAGGGRFSGSSGLKPYLYTIGRNLALNHLKKHRRQHLSYEDITEGDRQAHPSPEGNYLREEKNQLLYKTMQNLKEEHREVLHLLYFENMSYEQAGKVLGKTRKQIDNLAAYAKTKLKSELEREGVGGYEE